MCNCKGILSSVLSCSLYRANGHVGAIESSDRSVDMCAHDTNTLSSKHGS